MKTKHRNAAHAKHRYQADPGSMYKLMAKLQPFTRDEVSTLVVPARTAFEKLRNGVGTEDDFNTICGAINVTIVLAEKIDPFAEQIAIAARDASNRTLQRHRRIGKWGFDGVGLEAIYNALDLHDQAIALLTPLQVSNAAIEVMERKKVQEAAQ
jgi:hypothetical protein